MLRVTRWAFFVGVAGAMLHGCGARSGDDWPLQASQRSGGGTAGVASGGTGAVVPLCSAPNCSDCSSCTALCECSGGDPDYCVEACNAENCTGPECANCASCAAECRCEGRSSDDCLIDCGLMPTAGGSSGYFGGAPGFGGAVSFGGFGTGTGGMILPGVGGQTFESCCTTHASPLCNDLNVAACVCSVDAFCCTSSWDMTCVNYVDLAGCGSCVGAGGSGAGGSGGSGGSGGMNGGGTGGFSATGGSGATGGLTGTGGFTSTEPCCRPHLSPGCVDASVTSCVCAADPYCCEHDWDVSCARRVESLGCGSCSITTGGSTGSGGAAQGGSTAAGGTSGSDGATPSGGAGGSGGSGGIGGTTGFGGAAAGTTGDSGGAGNAGGVPSNGGAAGSGNSGSGGFPLGECCEVHDTPGCDEPDIESCVCAQDPFCCQASWDRTCAGGVEAALCGSCGGGSAGASGAGGSTSTGGNTSTGGAPPLGDCCEVHAEASCVEDDVSACVCAGDPYCCETAWDMQCTTEVTTSGCGECDTPLGQCLQFADTPCETCLCTSCLSSAQSCDAVPGCQDIVDCATSTGCSGFSCYLVCGGVIEASGGILGAATLAALSLAQCGTTAGCACP